MRIPGIGIECLIAILRQNAYMHEQTTKGFYIMNTCISRFGIRIGDRKYLNEYTPFGSVSLWPYSWQKRWVHSLCYIFGLGKKRYIWVRLTMTIIGFSSTRALYLKMGNHMRNKQNQYVLCAHVHIRPLWQKPFTWRCIVIFWCY